MKLGKRKLTFILIIVLICSGLIFLMSKEDGNVALYDASTEVDSSRTPRENVNKEAKSVRRKKRKRRKEFVNLLRPRRSFKKYAVKKWKGKRKNILHSHERISLGKMKLSKVLGVTGQSSKDPHMKELAYINGIYFYKTNRDLTADNVIYNHHTNKFGVWTKEIKIEAPEQKILELENNYDLEIVLGGAPKVIVKAGTSFDNESDLVSLLERDDIFVELDIRYAYSQAK